MTFEEYLIKKKIDSVAFKLAEPAQWQEWSVLFESMSEASFTAQKLYLINPTRRKYLLKEELIEKPKPTPAAAKPVMRPKPKMN
jgi:hypothetical protein